MKKRIISALLGCTLLSTQLLAEDSTIYIGIDGINSSNTFTYKLDGYTGDTESTSNSNALKLKLGWIRENGGRTQIYYLQERYDDTIFDTSNNTLTEVGLDFIKDFQLSPVLSPFIQAGIGYGWMDIDGYSESEISEVNAKAGGGLVFRASEKIELLIGVDFQVKKWSDRKSGSSTIETNEDSTKYYVGANLLF
ncbi:hypothetical protein [Sulfurimonas sp.]|uniref:hypothetical protein n=1 Tax=Sulfurimonas sp. TaxID=2022749 RepID=UPI0025F2FB5D|nr:hypothetical protein [Sulfurimonas sp.]